MNGAEELVATLSGAGLAIPPMLGLDNEIQSQGRWQWGSRPCDRDRLYLYDVDSVIAAVRGNPELFLLSHGGHGANSYGLTLVLSQGPLAAYVQHSFGGVYGDADRDKQRIAATYTHLRAVWDTIADTPGPVRWLLLQSNFRDIRTLIDLAALRAGTRWHTHREDFPDEPALFAAATHRLRPVTR